MSVRKDSLGRPIVDTWWPDGLRTRKLIPDPDQAADIDLRIRASLVDGTWQKLRAVLNLENKDLGLLKDLADEYLENYVQSQNRDITTKESRLKRIKAKLGRVPIDGFRASHITTYVTWRKKGKRKVCNATINREVTVLRHMMSWAVEEGYLEANPLARRKQLKETQWDGPAPTDKALDKIFKQLPAVVVPLFTFIRETGCRREEALSLKRTQVDLDRGQVLFVGNTKSGKARRVPLTQKAIDAVKAMPKSPKTKTVFYNPDTGKRWWDCRKPWERARTKAGFPRMRVQDLRRAYGIKLAEAGCPMHFIQAMLGHHSVALTEKYYAQFSPDSAGRAVLRLLEGGKSEEKQAVNRQMEKAEGVR